MEVHNWDDAVSTAYTCCELAARKQFVLLIKLKKGEQAI